MAGDDKLLAKAGPAVEPLDEEKIVARTRQHVLRICAGRTHARREERPTMKPIIWVALAATAFLALALIAGKDDIRRFRRMHSM